jgi:predicted phage terminase large subunit-like protein
LEAADFDLLERIAQIEARADFWAFRQYMNPKMKNGWWQREIAGVLTKFYQELIAGNRPKYVIEAPPQHGKSFQVIDFIAWLAGHHPEVRAIYASFSERLGVRANLRLQRIYGNPKYQVLFPETRINTQNSATISGQYLRNREMLEYVDNEGYFRNTTVRGSITGEGLDLGVIDDPIKGRESAGSETVRDSTWDWFTDDFFTRFSEDAGLLCILTRWHIDDPVGRLLELDKTVKVFKYPAIAVKEEKNRKIGEALFPEHKSLEFILERKKVMDNLNFEALYQQNPQIVGGQVVQGTWFKRYGKVPPIKFRKIYADTAQKTKESNDYSVFQCWGMGFDNRIYLLDQIRGKWEAPELKKRAVDFWIKHKSAYDGMNKNVGELREMLVEDKSSGTGLIQEIQSKGKIPIKGIQRSTDKCIRVQDASPSIEAGYVWIPEESPWVSDYVNEFEMFSRDDSHQNDDQIDPTCDAIKDLLWDLSGMRDWEGMI